MRCKIIKDFKGSQDGRIVEQFTAGTEVELSDYLVSCVDKAWIKPAGQPEGKAVDGEDIQNKAVSTDGKQSGVVKNKAKQ